MIIKDLTVGPIMANCFILGCDETKEAVVIDPGAEAAEVFIYLLELDLDIADLLVYDLLEPFLHLG